MKISLYLLLLSFIFNIKVQGQQIPEDIFYANYGGFESEFFEFKENNKFNYTFFTCIRVGIGTGTYEIKRNSLYLNFMTHPKYEKMHRLQFQKGESDSLIIDLKIIDDESGDFLSEVICYFPEILKGTVSDTSGKAYMKFKKISDEKTLVVKSIGYFEQEILITPEITKVQGTIQLANFWFYDSKDNFKVKLFSNNEGRLKLKRYKGLKHRNQVFYKKIEEEEISSRLENRIRRTYRSLQE